MLEIAFFCLSTITSFSNGCRRELLIRGGLYITSYKIFSETPPSSEASSCVIFG
eukprot:UN12718